MKAFLLVLTLCASLCAAEESPRPKSESWDQENLKQNDHGCPTAIYIVIHDELVQCGSPEPPYYPTKPYKGENCWVQPFPENACEKET